MSDARSPFEPDRTHPWQRLPRRSWVLLWILLTGGAGPGPERRPRIGSSVGALQCQAGEHGTGEFEYHGGAHHDG